jgi:pyruvate-formate lyase-activating enzyme
MHDQEAAMSLSAKKSRRLDVDFTNLYPPFPREVFFDLNNTCNSRCFFCSNSKISEPAYLDKAFGFKLLRDFFECGAREAAFFATGEPFLRTDLAEFIREAKSIGYEYVFLNSNGIAASPERARPVLEAGLDSIKFSINAGSRESYKKVHGVDRFDQVIQNIRWFHEFRTSSRLPYHIYVSMVPTSMTKDEFPMLSSLLAGFVDEIDSRGCSNQGGNMLENNRTEAIDKGNLLGSLRQGRHSGRCPDVFSRCTVTPQGYLSACVVDYHNYLVVADLHKTHVKDAWHNEAYVALRKKHSTGDLEGLICNNCLNNCGGTAEPLDPGFVQPFKAKPGAARKNP